MDDVSAEIQSIDEYRSRYPEETEDSISVIRNNDYKDKALKPLNQLYGAENAFLVSKAEEETPNKLAQQAYQKLEKLANLLDIGGDRITDSDELLAKVKDIQKLVGKIKMKID